MVDIIGYINLSEKANSIKSPYSDSINFKDYYNSIEDKEKESVIRHFIVNNIPFAFKDKPILYEQITQYISDKLHLSPSEVKLIGSAKTGFSISPPPNYGKIFGQHSDLDFSIINKELFNNLKDEFNHWAYLFKSRQLNANNKTEERYWFQNLDSVPRLLGYGFIDTHFIPNRHPFLITRTINNSLWLIKKYMDEKYFMRVKKASASIYKDWDSFAIRLNRNTNNVMKNVR